MLFIMNNTEDIILEFLVPRLLQLKAEQRQQKAQRTLNICSSRDQRNHTIIVGISGCQGSGKSTVASRLVTKLSTSYNLNVAEISLDDLYHTHAEQKRITLANPENSLLRTRGQPGTHDVQLAKAFFRQFRPETDDMVGDGKSGALFWPAFDKSLFNGKGDRVTQANWKKTDSHPALDVIIFEGWCIGFQPLGHPEVKNIWRDAQGTDKKLASTRLQDVLLLDDELNNYCDSFMSSSMLDFMVHLDVQSLETIYTWREEQEQKLRQRTGGLGMMELEVRKFGRPCSILTYQCCC